MKKTLIYGEEPYLIDKFRKETIRNVEFPEWNLLETSEFTEVEQRFLEQCSMFGEKKVLIYQTLNIKDCTELIDFLEHLNQEINIYIFCKEVDKRNKLFKRFNKDEIKIFDKLTKERLERTIVQYIKNKECEIKSDAYQRYLQLINYDSEETNLYDVLHSLERLCATKLITVELVEQVVLDRETEDIYSLIRLIDKGEYSAVFHQAEMILQNQKNNVIGVLSLLLRSYRLAYKTKLCNCSLKEIGVHYYTYVPILEAEQCHQAMNILDIVIRQIKSGFYVSEIGFKIALARLCTLKTNKK